MFRTVPLSIIRILSLYTAMVYVIQVCWQLASRIRTELILLASCQQTCMYCCVYSEKLLMMDRGTCPEHVEFYSKIKFEKLVHIFDFIIKIYTIRWTPLISLKKFSYQTEHVGAYQVESEILYSLLLSVGLLYPHWLLLIPCARTWLLRK